MNGIIAFVRFVDRINYIIGKYFVSWIILLLMVISLYAVFMRRLIGTPAAWTFEVLAYIFCAHFVLALGYTLYYREHVNVDILVNQFSEKTQAIIEVAAYLFFIGMFVYFLLPAGYNFAERSWLQGERAATGANLPVYPGKTLIPLGIAFLAVQAVAHVLKNLVFIFTDRKI
jgi:TRAP-type mannitol/chloroaromatic compound transport system permease small subunit